MKLFFTFFLFIITAYHAKSALVEGFDNYLLFSYKNNFQSGNVLKIAGGFRFHEHNLNYGNGLTKVDLNMLHIKPSVYFRDPLSKSKIKFAFSLINFNFFGTSHDDRRLLSMNLKLINYNPTNFYENYADWFQINLKGGYNLFSKNSRIIAPMISGSMGYSTIKPGSEYFSELSSYSKEIFTGLNINLGMFLVVNYKFIDIKISSEYDVLFGNERLKIWKNAFRLKMIDVTEIEKTDIDFSYIQFIENYCINLMYENKTLYVSDLKQTMNIVGIEIIKYIH
ncbi:hypothetical protein ACFLSQ_03195 [Bacteroidota bacterium]